MDDFVTVQAQAQPQESQPQEATADSSIASAHKPKRVRPSRALPDPYNPARHQSIVNKADIYPNAFTPERQEQFFEAYKASGMRMWKTSELLGIGRDTIYKAMQSDESFRSRLKDIENQYIDELEAKSRDVALMDKGVVDRMCQLRALVPEKYARDVTRPSTQVLIQFDRKVLDDIQKRMDATRSAIEAELVDNSVDNSTEIHQSMKSVELQNKSM